MTTRKLSETQLAECKKAFRMCDADGSGTIDGSELRAVVAAVTHSEPTSDELSRLFRLMDADHNGAVDLDEFLVAMSSWLGDDDDINSPVRPSLRKRSTSTNIERRATHKKIKHFLAQFSRSDTFEQIHARRVAQDGVASVDHSRAPQYKHALLDENELDARAVSGGAQPQVRSSSEKLALLTVVRQAIPRISTIVTALGNPSTQGEAAVQLANVLSVVEVFSSPSQRRSITVDLVNLFEAVLNNGVVTALISILDKPSPPDAETCHSVLRCLTYIAPGPRIGSTPVDSVLHPSKMFFKKVCIHHGLMTSLENRITEVTTHPRVMEQSIVALGALVASNAQVRDLALHTKWSMVLALIELASNDLGQPFRNKVAWVLSLFCGVTHPLTSLPSWDHVVRILPAVARLLWTEDADTVRCACSALSLIMPGTPEDRVDERLVTLLAVREPVEVASYALHVVREIITYDEPQTAKLLQFGLLGRLFEALKSNEGELRLASASAIGELIRSRGQGPVVARSEMLDTLLQMLQLDEMGRWKSAEILKYLTAADPGTVGVVVERGAIPFFCSAVTHFRVYDQVLLEVYSFVKAMYNFDFMQDILASLCNILCLGEWEANRSAASCATPLASAPLNKYALLFELQNVDCLKRLMVESRSDEAKPYRKEWIQIEQVVESILTRVLRAAKMAATPTSQAVATFVRGINEEFFGESPRVDMDQSSDAVSVPVHARKPVLLKCKLNEDVRVVEVPGSVSFQEFHAHLVRRYGRQLVVTWQDGDGDRLTIDSETAWHVVLEAVNMNPFTQSLLLYDLAVFQAELSASTSSSSSSSTSSSSSSSSPSPSSPAPSSAAPEDRRNNFRRKGSVFSFSTTVPTFSIGRDLELIRAQETRAMFAKLEKDTHFGAAELTKLLSTWREHASAKGDIGRKEFAVGMNAIGITDPLAIEQNFTAFDTNHDGSINFLEFAVGLSTLQRGSPDERMKFMFDAYDQDDSGYLEPLEVFGIFKSTMRSQGHTIVDNEVMSLVNECFKELDLDHDGRLSLDEFRMAVKSQKLIIDTFVLPETTSS
eukprot:TRINITY_DN7116_c0_g1_i1.p1 TRINITY_DN7116_c0_g1~~TRINITY_DN7116_c0_g1_i1.p1  ORF type:complete len:1058 (+),score=241.94 TRINITY_DN7116_c0_g1_i1:247-3420(+)